MSQPTDKPPRYDSVWKALPVEVLLALLRLRIAGIGSTLQPWKTDLKQFLDRAIDGAFLTVINGIKTMVLLEYQNYLDNTMPWRVYIYVALLKMQYYEATKEDIPVLPVVIWAVDGHVPLPSYANIAAGETYGTSRYAEIRLAALDWHGVEPELLVLAPFLGGVTPTDLPVIAATMYQHVPAPINKQLLAALLTLSQRKYDDFAALEASILQQVGTTMDEIYTALREGHFGTALLAEGRQEGEAIGRQEGEAIGRQETQRHTFALVWRQRFGTELTEAESERVAQFSQERYDAALAALIDPATSPDQARTLLHP